MLFSEFAEFGRYPLRGSKYGGKEKNVYKAVSAFFLSPMLRPYTEAIMCSGSETAKHEAKQRVRALKDNIGHFINESDAVKEVATYSRMWDELSVSRQGRAHSILDRVLPTYMQRFAGEIDALVAWFTETGSKVLANEVKLAETKFPPRPDTIIDLATFVYDGCWVNMTSRHDRVITPVQLMDYGLYLLKCVGDYQSAIHPTENKRQAQKLHEVVHKIIAGYKHTSVVKEGIHKKQAEVDAQLDVHRHEHAILDERIQALKADLLRQKRETAGVPDRTLTLEEAYHWGTISMEVEADTEARNHPDMEAEFLRIMRANNALYQEQETLLRQLAENQQYLCDADGKLDVSHPLYREFQACVNYWGDNLPRIRARTDQINAFALGFSAPLSTATVVIYRNVTLGERDAIVAQQCFAQSPESSLEREKWFYKAGASPGSGVTHPYKCQITLKPGVMAHIDAAIQSDGKYATFVRKEAEPGCFGVHEDALPLFNSLITQVRIVGNRSGVFSNQVVMFSNRTIPEVVAPFMAAKSVGEKIPIIALDK